MLPETLTKVKLSRGRVVSYVDEIGHWFLAKLGQRKNGSGRRLAVKVRKELGAKARINPKALNVRFVSEDNWQGIQICSSQIMTQKKAKLVASCAEEIIKKP